MVAKRVLVICATCGKGYTARKTEDKIIVPTNDGCCICGEREFDVAQGVT